MKAPIRFQRGQAMSEFIAALAVFLPLFFGIYYVGKFADIKHQAIQASRYAAFERALDPNSSQESAGLLQEETRARFFPDGARNGGKLAQDNTSGLATASTLNPLWDQVNGTPLMQNYSEVSVAVGSSSMDIGAFTPINEGSKLFSNLNTNGQIQADVEVPIANVTHLPAPLNALNLKVAARTVVAGDAWGGDGAQQVADHQNILTDLGKNPALQGLKLALTPLAAVFSDHGPPKFGCLRPDVVPAQAAPGASYSPDDPCY
jgi:hypothetical protein